MAIGLELTSCWSEMPAEALPTSGAKTEKLPEWGADTEAGTAVQPQPPGAQVGTTELNAPRVPLSKPSASGCEGLQEVPPGVNVGEGVAEGVKVRV